MPLLGLMWLSSCESVDVRRVRLALVAAGFCPSSLARVIGCSVGHLFRVLAGERAPGARLVAAVERQLGPELVAYVRGATNVIVPR